MECHAIAESIIGIGIVLLGVVLFLVAVTRRRRLRQSEREMSDRLTRENWGKEEIH
jgi:hypothetical protein